MQNPFEELESRLIRIERLLLQYIEQAASTSNEPAKNAPIFIEQASKLLGIAVGTIYQNIDAIPHRKKHGRLYFFESELLEYLKSDIPKHTPSILHPSQQGRKKRVQQP